MEEKKIYVLDTNVLLHDPTAIYAFKGAEVGVPSTVIEELDRFKGEPSSRGRNAREAIRTLDQLREHGSLREGVQMSGGGLLRVIFLPRSDEAPNIPFHLDKADNEVLLTALMMKEKGYETKFISKDLNARVKADSLGIETEDYIREHISEDEFYKGWIQIDVPAVQLKKENPEELRELAVQSALDLNEFVLLSSQHNPFNYRVFRYLGGSQFKSVYDPEMKWPLKSRNPQQLMALDLLFDNAIQFVTLFGPAGTGKTFLALLAGLHKILIEDVYEKMLITRPVVPLGRDIGYLPGSMEEKLHSWMLPIYDNMEFIIHAAHINAHGERIEHERHGRKGKKGRRGGGHKEDRTALRPLEELIKHRKVSLEAITYMRGRSIPYQFIIIDEVQNLTPHEVKTLISRVGEGSKIILCGDPYQIDSPYLDFCSNGLVVASERFKGQKLFGSVYLETSERSELSQLANDLM